MEKEDKSHLWYRCPVCITPVFTEFHDIPIKCKCGCMFIIRAGWQSQPPRREDTGFKKTQ